jgi:excisionase family DNA binding protein
VTTIRERAERKLAAGEALSTGEAAALLGVDKTTVIRMAERGEIAATKKTGVGRYWQISAAAVRTELAGQSGNAEGGQAPSA